MHEYDMKTVNVPMDEYFELRKKADMNALIIQQFGKLEEKCCGLDYRIYDLERKLKEVEKNESKIND